VENLRIVQVFGPEARRISPRVGHIHLTVDDLPGGGLMPVTTTRST
jgi:hypothetical protein